MEINELLEMNVDILKLLSAEQIQLPDIMKSLVKKMLDENEKKLKELI